MPAVRLVVPDVTTKSPSAQLHNIRAIEVSVGACRDGLADAQLEVRIYHDVQCASCDSTPVEFVYNNLYAVSPVLVPHAVFNLSVSSLSNSF